MNTLTISRPSILLMFAAACLFSQVHTHAQTVLSLPEMVITSFHGVVGNGSFPSNKNKLVPPVAGQEFTPLRPGPGTRIYIGELPPSHAIVSFPGAGACMLGERAGILLPADDKTGMTVSFTPRTGSPARIFLNISAAEMAKHGGAVFRFGNRGRLDSNQPGVIFTTTGGRFYVCDEQSLDLPAGMPRGDGCTVAVYDGSITIKEVSSGQEAVLKPGSALLVTQGKLGQPRSQTKAEASFDIGCKLAVLGRPAPARLHPTMKTAASTSLKDTKVNSLGMVFVPVPGTKVLMCAHETRWQDFAPFMATLPLPAERMPHAKATAMWGWDDHPVQTNWDNANAFCLWLSQKEGKNYRLPTDEEWSYAVGIGSKEKFSKGTTPEMRGQADLNIFPWGTVWPPRDGTGNLRDRSYDADRSFLTTDALGGYDDGFIETAPVMSFMPNKLGIYDLAGNVAEWCDDWYNVARTYRVIRGSSYFDGSQSILHSAYRKSGSSNQRYGAGFRVVMEHP